jgi:CDP-diacylglycerol--serine O-phosphatidyltransferase
MVTLGNLAAGFLAIAYVGDYVRDVTASVAVRGTPLEAELLARGTARLELATWLIFVGMLFDALDGYVARLTRQQSDFGVELDSLSDLVTFGLAPAFLAKSVISVELSSWYGLGHVVARDRVAWVFAMAYVMCAAMRLARFNVDTDEEDAHTEFMGLPSPAAASVVAGVVILYLSLGRDEVKDAGLWTVQLLRVILPLAGLAMVSRIRYYHFVNTYLSRRRPVKNTVSLGVIVLIVLLLWTEYVVMAVALAYFLSGPIYTLRRALHERRHPLEEPT